MTHLIYFFREKSFNMRRVLAFLLAGFLFASFAIAQDQKLLKEYTRSEYFGGAKLSFILLTNKTIDTLFTGASKENVKAKINGGTAFYVLGTAEKNTKLNTSFIMVQDEQKFTANVTNLKNFADGDIAKGEKISAIIQFDKKINAQKLFTVKNSDNLVDFKLTDNAIMNLNN
jgi:hypothetical protein